METDKTIIKYTNVGRNLWCARKEYQGKLNAQSVAEVAYREIKNILASRFPDVEYDEETNKGAVFAGGHHVGNFEVVK